MLWTELALLPVASQFSSPSIYMEEQRGVPAALQGKRLWRDLAEEKVLRFPLGAPSSSPPAQGRAESPDHSPRSPAAQTSRPTGASEAGEDAVLETAPHQPPALRAAERQNAGDSTCCAQEISYEKHVGAALYRMQIIFKRERDEKNKKAVICPWPSQLIPSAAHGSSRHRARSVTCSYTRGLTCLL